MSYASEVLADAPWGYWKCDEASGATLADVSGNGRPATITGSPTMAALGPDGVTKDAIDWPSSTTTEAYAATAATTTATTMTVEAWVFLTAAPSATTPIVGRAAGYGTNTQTAALYVGTDRTLTWLTYRGGASAIRQVSGQSLSLNGWHHVVASIGPAGSKIRVDKVQWVDGAGTAITAQGNEQILLHGGGNSGRVPDLTNGSPIRMGEVAVYPTQLSDARTDAHYDAMFAGRAPTFSGSLAAVTPRPTASLAGSYGAPTYTGALAANAPQATATLTGTYARQDGVFSGTLAARPPAAFATLTGTYAGTITTNTANKAGGRHRGGKALVTVEPLVVDPPDTLAITFPQDVAIPLPDPMLVKGRPTNPAYAAANRDALYKAGGRGRIIVGGRDITFLRGIPLVTPSYELVEPFGYGSTVLSIPQVNLLFEARPKWSRDFAKVAFQRVFADGTVVTDYRGEVLAARSENGALTLDIAGALSGSAGLSNEQPPLRWVTHDVGWWAFNASRPFIHMTPRFGPDTGIRIAKQGGEMTTVAWLQQIGTMSQKDGQQRALMPKVWGGNEWRFDFKDTTTVHATVFLDGVRAAESLADDVSEKPNTFYGTGVTPDGMRWRNSRYPQAMESAPPAFPMGGTFGVGTTNADTRDGSGISVLQIKLQWAGYLDQDDYDHGTYDDATAQGVKRLQRAVGLPRTGTVNTTTWNRLWNTDATATSLKAAHIAPLVQDPRVSPWLYTANGSIAGKNPDHVPGFREVSRNYDFGSGVRKGRATDWCEHQEEKYAGKNWAGTITLNGVGGFAGKWEHGDSPTEADVLGVCDFRPGMNVWLPGFDDGTLVHVSGVQFTPAQGQSPASAVLTVDTLARDLMELQQVIDRNRASRRSPRREWNRENRAHGPNHNQITFDEFGGVLQSDRRLQGGRWNKVGLVCGQTGTLERVDLVLSNAKAEFCIAISSVEFSPAKARRRFGNPFVVNSDGESWVEIRNIQELLDNKRLLYVAGDGNQPLGYDPRRKFSDKTDANGDPIRTSAPITGRYRDDAGVPYKTPPDRNPLVWLLIWPDRDCTLQSGRLLYKSEDDAV